VYRRALRFDVGTTSFFRSGQTTWACLYNNGVYFIKRLDADWVFDNITVMTSRLLKVVSELKGMGITDDDEVSLSEVNGKGVLAWGDKCFELGNTLMGNVMSIPECNYSLDLSGSTIVSHMVNMLPEDFDECPDTTLFMKRMDDYLVCFAKSYEGYLALKCRDTIVNISNKKYILLPGVLVFLSSLYVNRIEYKTVRFYKWLGFIVMEVVKSTGEPFYFCVPDQTKSVVFPSISEYYQTKVACNTEDFLAGVRHSVSLLKSITKSYICIKFNEDSIHIYPFDREDLKKEVKADVINFSGRQRFILNPKDFSRFFVGFGIQARRLLKNESSQDLTMVEMQPVKTSDGKGGICFRYSFQKEPALYYCYSPCYEKKLK
jgi:hypothetical protein